MTRKSITLTDEIYDYILKVSLREPPLLAELREETAKLPMSQMQIAPEQGQFMRLLAELCGVKKALEVGTFTGYSSLCIAMALPENGQMICCDTNPDYTAIAQRYWKQANLDHKIDLRLAQALTTLDDLIASGHAKSFDYLFIDADKQNYIGYFERGMQLVRSGGLILIDNVLWGGEVANEDSNDEETLAIRHLNEKLFKDERISLSMLPIGDGLTLARVR